jgi:hypothetical protein
LIQGGTVQNNDRPAPHITDLIALDAKLHSSTLDPNGADKCHG